MSTKTFSPAYASNGVNPYYINMAVTIDIDATDDDVQRLSSDSFSSCAVFSNCPLTNWLSELAVKISPSYENQGDEIYYD